MGGTPRRKKGFVFRTYRQAKKVVILVIGASVVMIGAALLVLPGPGVLTIALGLAILATEFVWARRLLRRMKREAADMARRVSGAMRSDDSDEHSSENSGDARERDDQQKKINRR